MLSYKEYKELNENINSTIALGVKPIQSIGQLQSKWDEMSMKMPMMMRKKAKKYMNPELPGDHELEEPDDMISPNKGRKLGKSLGHHHHDEEDMDHDMGDEEDDDSEEEFDDEDSEGDEEEEEDFSDEDSEGDEEEEKVIKKKKPGLGKPSFGGGMGGPDMGMGGGMGMKMMKKEHKHHEEEDEFEDDHDEDEFEDHDHDDEDEKPHPKGCKCEKCSGTSMCSKCMKKGEKKKMHNVAMMKKGKNKKAMKEHKDFYTKLKNQCELTYFDINPDGTFKEDAILPPENPNKNITVDDEPGPGEVGYAPQGKLGDSLGFSNFAEWTTKHKRAVNKKINKR